MSSQRIGGLLPCSIEAGSTVWIVIPCTVLTRECGREAWGRDPFLVRFPAGTRSRQPGYVLDWFLLWGDMCLAAASSLKNDERLEDAVEFFVHDLEGSFHLVKREGMGRHERGIDALHLQHAQQAFHAQTATGT